MLILCPPPPGVDTKKKIENLIFCRSAAPACPGWALQGGFFRVMFHSFFGGVHLDGRKTSTQRKPVAALEVEPERVVIPMRMHAGEPCVPTVRAGDRVEVGQPIAQPQGLGAVIHASVSGRVEAVGLWPHPWGGEEQAVVICNNGQNRLWSDTPEGADYCFISGQEIIERVGRMGITGLGGASYPTREKLLQAAGRVDTVIVNAAESEPYITADHRLLLEKGEAILTGVQILMKAVDARRGIVAVEGNKLNAVEALERRLRRRRRPVQVYAAPSRYPLGSEKQVVKSMTGREIPPGGTAADAGCVVFNVGTAYAVYQAVARGRALTHRAVTVTGAAVSRPRNLWVPIGTPLRCLVEAAGGFRDEPELVIMGGPMMGIVQSDLEAPVIKPTNSLVCMAGWERRRPRPEEVCLRCGRCVAMCPMHLMPLEVNRALTRGDTAALMRLPLQDCIECGCCTYTCPSGIPLVDRMRQAKGLVQAQAAGEEAVQ